jgi:hypothetical protein|tara:strand:- start:254 stop:610 length:357 start_codon:yes stop_codon:yes gene_type:complete
MKKTEYKNINFYIGQNAQENWIIFDEYKKLNENFIWFHLNSFPSPYVIMQSTLEELACIYNQEEIEKILNYGATLCKENSKYKFLNNLKIMYSPLKKITKGTKIGEVHVSGKRKLINL